MKRIGLTGGIGSGKSTVARIFQSLGIPIYFADDRGKFLLNSDVDLIEAVKAEFGEDIYINQALDRKKLGSIVFGDAAKLKKLNALVHPAVGRDYRAWCETIEGEAPYSIKEAAILIETGGHTEMDAVILVRAPEELRIMRVMSRDGVSQDEVEARLSKQWREEDKLPFSDFVIVNDGNHSLIEQVIALDKALRD